MGRPVSKVSNSASRTSWLHPGPRAADERLAGCGYGEVDVLFLAGRGGGVVGVGDRVEDIEGLAAHRINELSVDVVLDVAGQILRHVMRGCLFCSERHCCFLTVF
jgi:hypothetical protein